MPRTRKIVIGTLGATIVLFGIVLIFLPGPGLIVIPLGLAVLATEFVWARRVLRHGRKIVEKAKRSVKAARSSLTEKIP
jgi:uncharacterized protein (TIGR02611 family)